MSLKTKAPDDQRRHSLQAYILQHLRDKTFRVATQLPVKQSKPGDRAPASLAGPLWVVVIALCIITAAALTMLFLAGYTVGGFYLHHSVLATLAGGMSLQFAAAIVSPLAKGITQVIVERYKARGTKP